MATWSQVRAAIAQLPETREEANKQGRFTWLIAGRSVAWERPLRKSDLKAIGANAPTGPILALRTVDLEMKDAMLGSGIPGLFTIPHFNGYAAILVALDAVTLTSLKIVIAESWLAHAPAPAADAYLAKQRKPKPRPKKPLGNRK
jgi:hypothetical protein